MRFSRVNFSVAILAALVAFLAIGDLQAQTTTGRIMGTVIDDGGAVGAEGALAQRCAGAGSCFSLCSC